MNEQGKPAAPFKDVMNPTLEEIIALSEESLRDIAAGRVYDLNEAFFERMRLRFEDGVAERERQICGHSKIKEVAMPRMPTIAMLAVLAGCAAPPVRPPQIDSGPTIALWNSCVTSNASKLGLESREPTETVAVAVLARCKQHELTLNRLHRQRWGEVAENDAAQLREQVVRPFAINLIVTARAQRGL